MLLPLQATATDDGRDAHFEVLEDAGWIVRTATSGEFRQRSITAARICGRFRLQVSQVADAQFRRTGYSKARRPKPQDFCGWKWNQPTWTLDRRIGIGTNARWQPYMVGCSADAATAQDAVEAAREAAAQIEAKLNDAPAAATEEPAAKPDAFAVGAEVRVSMPNLNEIGRVTSPMVKHQGIAGQYVEIKGLSAPVLVPLTAISALSEPMKAALAAVASYGRAMDHALESLP